MVIGRGGEGVGETSGGSVVLSITKIKASAGSCSFVPAPLGYILNFCGISLK